MHRLLDSEGTSEMIHPIHIILNQGSEIQREVTWVRAHG